jgi:hypothetical protein
LKNTNLKPKRIFPKEEFKKGTKTGGQGRNHQLTVNFGPGYPKLYLDLILRTNRYQNQEKKKRIEKPNLELEGRIFIVLKNRNQNQNLSNLFFRTGTSS